MEESKNICIFCPHNVSQNEIVSISEKGFESILDAAKDPNDNISKQIF